MTITLNPVPVPLTEKLREAIMQTDDTVTWNEIELVLTPVLTDIQFKLDWLRKENEYLRSKVSDLQWARKLGE